jgi:DNA-binding PadR family transcriptional regulator
MSRVDLVVLGLLTEQPMHGYKIIRFFEKRGLVLWTRVKTASVYKALQRLENQNLISGKMNQEDNNPPKKVFTITKQGKQKFLDILRSFLFNQDKSISPMDFWHAVRFVYKNITRDEFIRALENHEKQICNHSEKMKRKHQEAKEKGKLQHVPFYATIMMKNMDEIIEMEKRTISEMKQAAMLPENIHDFAEEK